MEISAAITAVVTVVSWIPSVLLQKFLQSNCAKKLVSDAQEEMLGGSADKVQGGGLSRTQQQHDVSLGPCVMAS